jgi:hypothetical protein
LTPRGKGLLAGLALATASSFVFGLNLGLALTFALSLAMLVTVLRLRLRMATLNLALAGEATVRVPRGRSAAVEVETRLQRGGLSVEAISVRPPMGIDARVVALRGSRLELSVSPRYAGLFTGIETVYAIRDETGLFSAEKSARLESFRVESIPLNLVMEAETPIIAPIALDENPAGIRGHGQELYAIEESPETEARSVYWRGVARSSDGRMMVMVREAGLPDSVTIGMLEPSLLDVEKLQWMDLVSEALAKLGRILIRLGIRVEIVTASKRGLRVMRAGSVPELAQRIMKVWEEPQIAGREAEMVKRSDVVLIESSLLSSFEVAPLLRGKATLVIPVGGRPVSTEGAIHRFRIDEVDKLIAEVVG